MAYSVPLLITGSVLAIVSAIWSAILWTSFATSHQDKALAAVAAVALVACQTLFAAAAPEQPRALGIVIGLVAAVLVLASMAGTVGWLESRCQTLTATDTHRQQLLDAYTDKSDSIRLQRRGRMTDYKNMLRELP
jgi:hypothetical protein